MKVQHFPQLCELILYEGSLWFDYFDSLSKIDLCCRKYMHKEVALNTVIDWELSCKKN
jgi:hypothetical protein